MQTLLLLLACSGVAPVTDRPGGDERPGDSARDDSGPEVLPDDTDEPPPSPFVPVLRFTVEGGIVDGTKAPGRLEVIVNHDGTLRDLDEAPVDLEVPIGIEVHGSSSTGYPKLGYKFECRDAFGDDDDCALLDLPAGSDWVLAANYSDKSYMRNALAYGLGRAAAEDAGRWEPRTRYVEVVLNDGYLGVYLLVERVSREDDRLDIPPTTLEDGTVAGGFIVKVDQHRSAGFDTALGTPIDWSSPKYDEVAPREQVYIKTWFDQMEAVLTSDTYTDPVEGYAAWIDVDAWVDHWLLSELTYNVDAYRLSSYLWVDGPPGRGKMRAGPLWDYDRAWGNCNYCDTWLTEGWIYDALDRCGASYQFPFWWERLRDDPAFSQRLRARWDELRAGPLSDAAIHGRLLDMKDELASVERRDQQRWGTMGTWVDPNYYVGATWDEEIAWLESWAVARAAWMDLHVGE